MSGPATARPAICLNMIVKNEARVVQEALDSAAPYISYWVIVDTGSEDGTQDLIKSHMARLGIPGELHERTWRDFGHNRSEALTLAQDHGDYIWVLDADDIMVGTPDFTRLGADIYWLRNLVDGRDEQWRPLLFRNGLSVRYEGVIHESPVCDEPCVNERLGGQYHIVYRCLGARNVDQQQKLASDRDLLLAEVERNPDSAHAVLHLAQAYFALCDFANARKWYARRAEMGDGDEGVYYSMLQVAESMWGMGAPWPDVQDAYLRAWEVRQTRAEPLYAIAVRYRAGKRYGLAYQFAKLAAQIPFPEQDALFVRTDIYSWRAAEEQAICASQIGNHAEAFTLLRRLLARHDIPVDDRHRIAGNRDSLAPPLISTAASYPEALIQRLVVGARDTEVVVSLVAGPDLAATERMLNSFLQCCTDVSRVRRFLVVDASLSAHDRAKLRERYRFLEFGHTRVNGLGAQLEHIRGQIEGRFWLHLGQGWRFFARENFITRLTAVLEAETQVFQVAINFADAANLTGTFAAQPAVRRAPDAGRYVLTEEVASGPAMFDTARLDRVGGVSGSGPDPLTELSRRATAAGLCTASLDEVLCTT